MSNSNTPATKPAAPVVPVEAARDEVNRLIALHLEQDGGDGEAAIFAAILSGEGVDGLNAPWQQNADDTPIGIRLKIDSFRLHPSEFEKGLGVFAYVNAVNLETGEAIGFATGSGAIVVQLLKAHAAGLLPIVATVVEGKAKPGQKPPQRLDVEATYVVQG